MQGDSDAIFQKMMVRSRQLPAVSARKAFVSVKNPNIEELDKRWKRGEINYHDYSTQKFALQRTKWTPNNRLLGTPVDTRSIS